MIISEQYNNDKTKTHWTLSKVADNELECTKDIKEEWVILTSTGPQLKATPLKVYKASNDYTKLLTEMVEASGKKENTIKYWKKFKRENPTRYKEFFKDKTPEQVVDGYTW